MFFSNGDIIIHVKNTMLLQINKRIVLISAVLIVLIVGLAIGGYFLWKNVSRSAEEKALDNASNVAESITDSITKGVLPSLDIVTNPLENNPSVNPVDQTNPFKYIKTNPF